MIQNGVSILLQLAILVTFILVTIWRSEQIFSFENVTFKLDRFWCSDLSPGVPLREIYFRFSTLVLEQISHLLWTDHLPSPILLGVKPRVYSTKSLPLRLDPTRRIFPAFLLFPFSVSIKKNPHSPVADQRQLLMSNSWSSTKKRFFNYLLAFHNKRNLSWICWKRKRGLSLIVVKRSKLRTLLRLIPLSWAGLRCLNVLYSLCGGRCTAYYERVACLQVPAFMDRTFNDSFTFTDLDAFYVPTVHFIFHN
jgi:hypothetical protein